MIVNSTLCVYLDQQTPKTNAFPNSGVFHIPWDEMAVWSEAKGILGISLQGTDLPVQLVSLRCPVERILYCLSRGLLLVLSADTFRRPGFLTLILQFFWLTGTLYRPLTRIYYEIKREIVAKLGFKTLPEIIEYLLKKTCTDQFSVVISTNPGRIYGEIIRIHI